MVLALAAMFLGPLAASGWLYFHGAELQPRGRINYGTLLQPPHTLPELSLPTSAGMATAPGWLRGKWSLLYLARDGCQADCREALARTRSVRLALGRDRSRVQRVLLVDASCCDRVWLATEQPDLVTALLDEPVGGRLRAAFPDEEPAGRIYLVDPLGNLMMSYPPDAERRGMFQDLEKLLRLSQIGSRAGDRGEDSRGT